ncbi:tetratricopeptide repeat protein [Luteimonas deserti]|uniref:Tetratricopeptide repeat protein n=1 Tax=Luteimonas deserti TaxID=2752306 RepID=A0A7Z0QNY2_9GAMM|nr:tetratricopeptide repeat protein [Luteimonas deserti]NYZ61978.1 tetratricopeptide repeat protein [Luteimonas deserti]
MQDRILDALRRGANDEALDLARQAAADAPQDADVQRLLALALRATGDQPAALAALDAALALAPDDAELHFQRAGMLLGARDVEAALAALSQTVALDPNQFGAYVMQAQLAIGRGDLDEAERQHKLAARVAPDHPWTTMVEGTLASRRGEHDRALALLSAAAERAPDDLQILNALAFAYLARGHLAFAEQSFRRVLESTGQVQLRGLLARIMLEQGRPAEAADLITELLADPAQATPAWQTIAGELEIHAGRPERALPLLQAAFEAMPWSPRTTDALVRLWSADDAVDTARETLDRGLVTAPDADHLWVARLAFEAFGGEGAGAVVERWNAARPDHVPALQARLTHHAATGDLDAAEAASRVITALQPGHAVANEFQFNRLLERDPDAAIAFAEDLLPTAHDAARTMLRRWIGLAQDAAGRYTDAVATWASVSVEATEGTGHAPEPTAPPREWPPRPERDDAQPPAVFLYGGPGANADRIGAVLQRMIPAFRSDRFARGVSDAFQDTTAPARFAAGEFTAEQVASGWRAQLPARGIADGAIVDWLPWWDNAWVAVFRAQLPSARLLIALRDPRDMLVDWLAFGTLLTLRIEDIDRAAQWLARHLGQLADLVERDLVPHAIVHTDAPAADPATLATELGRALEIADYPAPPLEALGPDRFPMGHWRQYIQAMPAAIGALTPVAVRLGYPRD